MRVSQRLKFSPPRPEGQRVWLGPWDHKWRGAHLPPAPSIKLSRLNRYIVSWHPMIKNSVFFLKHRILQDKVF